jgi:hypothetical protein
MLLFIEGSIKEVLFNCSMCGQCIARTTGFICPRTCPKGIRNGPCGGAEDGMCEVYRDRRCVWCRIYERNLKLHRVEKIEEILPPIDWSLVGTSAWANLATGKADSHGRSARYRQDGVRKGAAERGEAEKKDLSAKETNVTQRNKQGESHDGDSK